MLILTLNFAQLSYLLTTLLFLSHILPSMSLCSSHPVFPPLHPQLSTLCPASLLILHLLPRLFPVTLSLHLPPPLPSSSSPPAVSPPLSTSVHPLMIAECISFDMKTKGWVHMWFLCKSCVIWNINVGIIWLPGWGGWGGGGEGFVITSDCRFLPQRMVRLSGWIEKQ